LLDIPSIPSDLSIIVTADWGMTDSAVAIPAISIEHLLPAAGAVFPALSAANERQRAALSGRRQHRTSRRVIETEQSEVHGGIRGARLLMCLDARGLRALVRGVQFVARCGAFAGRQLEGPRCGRARAFPAIFAE